MKRIGASLILLGIFISIIPYPFTSVEDVARYGEFLGHYKHNFRDLNIVLKHGEYVEGEGLKVKGRIIVPKMKGRIEIPYKYFLAAGITISFVGIAIIVFPRLKT